ncbi:hypothetical protein [Schaalia odontolytica]
MTDPRSALPAPAGVPQPGEAPVTAPATPTMPAPTLGGYAPAPVPVTSPSPKRPALSARGRIAAWVVIVVKLIVIVSVFIPNNLEDLERYVEQFTTGTFWMWLMLDTVIVVCALLYVSIGIKPLRYLAAAIVLVDYLIILPVLVHSFGGGWFVTFAPPQLGGDPVVVVLRVLFMWCLKWLCIIAACALVIPDFRASAGTQRGAMPAPSGTLVGYQPHAAAPAQPAVPQGAPVQMPTAQRATTAGSPAQNPSPVLAPPSGAPILPGTPADAAQASE